jgi:YHS domain-containing protein
MCKTCFILIALFALWFAASPGLFEFGGAPSGVAAGVQQAEESVIPLEGLDPVLLAGGKEVQGDEKISVKRGRFRYLFANAETKAAFEREPGRYEIQLEGTCARMGPTVQGNPDLFTVHDGRIYIFGSDACVKMFKSAPASFLEPVGTAAPAASYSEEAKKRGRALVEKAVEAMGGAARVDALVSYQEKGTVGSRSPQGVTEIKTSLAMLYPDKMRLERTLSFGTIATVVTPAGGFFVFPRGGSEMLDVQRAAFVKQLQSNPLALLRARRSSGFSAAAIGASKAGDTPVEGVEVSAGGVRATLGIDPNTGRVHSFAYRGRGNGGVFGQIVQTYSDYRNVGGLTLPFKVAGTFNGEAEPSLTSTIEAIVVNGDLSPALFEKPKPAVSGQ